MEKTAMDLRNEKLGTSVVKALKNRKFDAYYCSTKDQALEQAIKLIPEGNSVSWGGSMTIKHMGLIEALYQGNYEIIDRDKGQTPQEKKELAQKAFFADTYLSSTNALSEDGQLVNIDGYGNRVAAMSFGPENVIIIVGVNKIVKSWDDGIRRARHTAAPLNVQRFPGKKTPCMTTGTCENCTSNDCICSYIVITRMCNIPKRIKVIIVGEELGF